MDEKKINLFEPSVGDIVLEFFFTDCHRVSVNNSEMRWKSSSDKKRIESKKLLVTRGNVGFEFLISAQGSRKLNAKIIKFELKFVTK